MSPIPNPKVAVLALVLAAGALSAHADAAPRRIVTLAPSCAEVVAALGLGDRIVGVTDFTDWPPRVKSLPSVGSFTNFSVEAVAALEPDLVVATDDGNPSAALQSLRQIGIRVITMSVRTYAEIEPSILSLGEALGRSAEAKRVVAEMERVASCVAARTRNAHRPRVLFAYEMSPIVTAGAKTFNDKLITMAGGISITHDVSDPFPRLAIETVIARAPEVVIVSSVHPALDAKRWREMLGKWPAIPAVKRGRIHAIDSTNVDRPSQRIVLGLVLLARTIHPSLFAHGECRPEFP
jgi:cobalamin transport system substrate-binding protein